MICGLMFRNVKELVEIVGEYGIKKRKKFVVEGNKVVIEAPKVRGRGHSGWMPEFNKDCFLFYYVGFFPFKRLKRKLMVMEGANKCIEFKGKDVQVPIYDREASKRHIKANVLQKAGESVQKVSVPIFVYLLLFITVMLGIVNILVASGRVYF